MIKRFHKQPESPCFSFSLICFLLQHTLQQLDTDARPIFIVHLSKLNTAYINKKHDLYVIYVNPSHCENSLQMVQTVGWFVAVIDDIYVIRKPYYLK